MAGSLSFLLLTDASVCALCSRRASVCFYFFCYLFFFSFIFFFFSFQEEGEGTFRFPLFYYILINWCFYNFLFFKIVIFTFPSFHSALILLFTFFFFFSFWNINLTTWLTNFSSFFFINEIMNLDLGALPKSG